jgi:hypothetical protein
LSPQGTYDHFLGKQTLAKKVVKPDPNLSPEFWPFLVAGDSSNYEVQFLSYPSHLRGSFTQQSLS